VGCHPFLVALQGEDWVVMRYGSKDGSTCDKSIMGSKKLDKTKKFRLNLA